MQEVKLRATLYLPDVIRLQQYLHKEYNCDLDEKYVSETKIQDLPGKM